MRCWKVLTTIVAVLVAVRVDAAPAPLTAQDATTAGAKGGVVLNLGPHQGGEFPFINLMLTAGGFTSPAGFAFPAVLNADGYPVSPALPQDIGGVIAIPASFTDSSTHWVLEWSGKMGTSARPAFQFMLSNGVKEIGTSGCVSGSTSYNLTVFGTNCQIEFVFNGPHTGGTIPFRFLAGAAFDGSVKKLAFYRKAHQTAFRSGEIFNPDFISALQAVKPRVIRTLNWTIANLSNVANSNQLTPTTALTYGVRWDSTVWAGTAFGTDAYTARFSSATKLVDGLTLQVQFANSNTGPVTLDLNNLGAIPVGGLAGGPITTANAITANSIWTLTYDAALRMWLAFKGGVNSGVPLPVQIALANKLGADLWLNIPTHATDQLVTTLVTTARDGINASLNTWFEFSNEIWNFNDYAFPQTNWSVARGAALGFPAANASTYHSFYALRSRQVLGIVTSVYGAKKNYRRVLAFQAVGDASTIQKWRLQGFDLNAAAYPNLCKALGGVSAGPNCYGDPKFNSFPNRPVDYADVLSYATYYSGAQLANFDPNYTNPMNTGGPAGYSVGLLGAADDFASGDVGKGSKALSWVDWDIRQGTRNGIAGSSTLLAFNSTRNIGMGAIGVYASWEAIATAYDGKRPQGLSNLIVANYEGGMEAKAISAARCSALGLNPVYGNAGGKIDNLLTAYKKSSLFQQLVSDQISQFLAQPHSKYAAWYQLATQDQWSLYSGDLYSTPFTSLSGLK